MYKILIKGEAESFYENLSELDGIDCQEEFSEYFHNRYDDGRGVKENQQSLIDKGVCNGYLSFKYEEGKLWSITTYESPVELTEEEINILASYTQGQLSDGIGEGFEQFPCKYIDDEEVYISPWKQGQVLTTEQIKTDEIITERSDNMGLDNGKLIDLNEKLKELIKEGEEFINSLKNSLKNK